MSTEYWGIKMQIFRNVLLAGAAALLPAAAFASDLPPRTIEPVAPVVEPAFTWTGFFAGASAGYGRGDLDTHLGVQPTIQPTLFERALGLSAKGGDARVKESDNGFVVGGQIGYNYQLDPHWVIGAEADLQYAGLEAKKTFAGAENIPITVKTQLDWFGTARLRAGFALDRFLIYGTGGLAFGNIKSTAGVADIALSKSKNKLGWTVGGGAEYALTQHWTVRAEYLFVDLGKDDMIKSTSNIAQITTKTDVKVQTVRAGVNYKF